MQFLELRDDSRRRIAGMVLFCALHCRKSFYTVQGALQKTTWLYVHVETFYSVRIPEFRKAVAYGRTEYRTEFFFDGVLYTKFCFLRLTVVQNTEQNDFCAEKILLGLFVYRIWPKFCTVRLFVYRTPFWTPLLHPTAAQDCAWITAHGGKFACFGVDELQWTTNLFPMIVVVVLP